MVVVKMSSFSRFLKNLPFLPKRFRQQDNPSDTPTSTGQGLKGVTINVYELELLDKSGNPKQEKEEGEEGSTDAHLASDEEEVHFAGPVLKPHFSTMSSHELPYLNITVLCSKCRGEVPVLTLQYHRRRHQALQALRYSTDFPPITIRGLVRRRNKMISDVKEMVSAQEGHLIRAVHKINVAFELLKSELHGISVEQIGHNGRWKEKDIKTEGTILNDEVALGVSKYGKPDTSSSITKCIYVDDFLQSGKGVFLGIYQGHNGSYVAHLCVHELHKYIRKNLQRVWDIDLNAGDIKAVFQEAYQRIDRIQLMAEGEHPLIRWSGCSAVTCFLVGNMLYVANEGCLKGLLVRDNNTMREVTSVHNLYNQKERMRVRRNQGVIVKTEKCALVNGVLATTRGLGNQGDWRLKVCVINRPAFRALSLKETDKILVLASEGLWKVFNYSEILFLLNKFIHEALTEKTFSESELEKEFSKTGMHEGHNLLRLPKTIKHDSEYRSFVKQLNKSPVDFRVPQNVDWRANNPQILIRKASVSAEESSSKNFPGTMSWKSDFSEGEHDDDDLRELARIINEESESFHARREISRLLSKRLLKSALIAGAEMDNVVMVLLLQGFKIECMKFKR